MSTRATYGFLLGTAHAVFYVHMDGYLEGAAAKFWAMHHADRRDFCTSFVVGNATCQLTESHATHGDTEYRYQLTEDGLLTATGRNDWQTNDFVLLFHGHYAEFINRYGRDSCPGFEPLHEVTVSTWTNHKQWLTRSQLVKLAEAALQKAEDYQRRFPTYTGNLASMAAEARVLTEALASVNAAMA